MGDADSFDQLVRTWRCIWCVRTRGRPCVRTVGTGFSGSVSLFKTVTVAPAPRCLLAEGDGIATLAPHAFVCAWTLAGSARALARDGGLTADRATDIARGAEMRPISVSAHPHLMASPDALDARRTHR